MLELNVYAQIQACPLTTVVNNFSFAKYFTMFTLEYEVFGGLTA